MTEITKDDIHIYENINDKRESYFGIEIIKTFINESDVQRSYQQILQALEDSKKWKEHVELQNDPRLKKVTMTFEEMKYLKELKKRIEERIKKEESKDHSPECMGCERCYLIVELQRLLEEDKK